MKLKKLKKPQLDDCIQQCVWMKNLIGNELFLVSCTTLNGIK